MPSVTNSANAKSTGSVASLTFSHVSDGNPLYVHVGLWNNLSTQPRRSSVTFNGVELECVAVSAGGSQWTHEVWYLSSPGSATANIVITSLGSNTWLTAASNNVSGGTRPNAFIFESGTGTAPSAAISSATGDLVLDLVTSDATSQTWTQGAGQTLIGSNTSANSDAKCANSREAGAATVTMSWTLGVSDDWAISAFNIPATPSTTDVVQAIHDASYSAVGGSSKSLTFNHNTQAGNAIVFCVQYPVGGGVPTLMHVTDTQGNVYVEAGVYSASGRVIQQWIARDIVGGACTVTVVFTGSISTYQSAIEINGGAFGSSATAETSGTSHNAGTVTTTGAAILIETGAMSGQMTTNEASDGFLPIRTQGQMVINVRPVSAAVSTNGPYTSSGGSITTENLLIAYGEGTQKRGCLVAGEHTTVKSTRTIAFGLDGDTHEWSLPGTFVVWGKTRFYGQYGSPLYDAGNSGTSKTLDWNNGNTQHLTLTGDCTLTLINPIDGFRYLIHLLQDGSGSHGVTWPAEVIWSGGVAPTLSTAAGALDIVTLTWHAGIGAAGNYVSAANTDYTPV